MTKWMEVSDKAKELLGDVVTVTTKMHGRQVKIKGTVVAVERTGSTIERDGKRYPGVRYRIKTKFGHRWTVTFPDEGIKP